MPIVKAANNPGPKNALKKWKLLNSIYYYHLLLLL